VVNLNRALDALKDEGYRVVGLAAEGSVSLVEADLDGPLVIVTGSEGDGLSMLTRKHCDQLVSIPLRGATPSLNASVATAMVLYEVARRSWMKDLRGGQPAPRIQRPQLASGAQPTDSTPVDDLAAAVPIPDFPGSPERETAPDTWAGPWVDPAGAMPFSAFPVAEPASAPDPGTMDSTTDSTS
jgi:23S rRNA (guanosine2251-2'-O)-methyltransferase